MIPDDILRSPDDLDIVFLRYNSPDRKTREVDLSGAEVKAWFEAAEAIAFAGIEHSVDKWVESGHHRRETRRVWAVPLAVMGKLHKVGQWAGLQTIVMVNRVRQLWNKTTRETMFYLSSLPCDAQRIGRAIRIHWGIENQLHWVLDVTFGEDASRIRSAHAPQNMALLKRLAISVLNQPSQGDLKAA